MVKQRDSQSKHPRFSNISWSHSDILTEIGVVSQFLDSLKLPGWPCHNTATSLFEQATSGLEDPWLASKMWEERRIRLY